MNDIFAFMTDLMTQHASTFEDLGMNMFRSFAVILVAWYGIKNALSAAGGGSGPLINLDQFASLVMTIAFGFAMITYYSKPIPGFGVSFSNLIVDQGLELANKLNHSMVQELSDRFGNLYFGMEMPALSLVFNIMEWVRYVVTAVFLVIALAAVYMVIGFGYVAMAIAVLLGPIFIPFLIVPKLEWLFWGWLKSFIQYAFYPVVANAYLFVFGNLMIHFIDANPVPWTAGKLVTIFYSLLCLLAAFTFGVLKVPSLVNSLFTGKSGEGTPLSF